MRESPTLLLLREKRAEVQYHDLHVPAFNHDGMAMTSVDDLEATLLIALLW